MFSKKNKNCSYSPYLPSKFTGTFETNPQLPLALHDDASYEHNTESIHYQNHYSPYESQPCYVTEDHCLASTDINSPCSQYYTSGYHPPCTPALPTFQTSFQPYYEHTEIKSEDDSEFVDQSSFMCRKGKRGQVNYFCLVWIRLTRFQKPILYLKLKKVCNIL